MVRIAYTIKIYDKTGSPEVIEGEIVDESGSTVEQVRADIEEYLEQYSGEIIEFKELT